MQQLVELDTTRCRNYLIDTLSGIGNIIDKIVTGPQLDDGKFYVMMEEQPLKEDIYDLETAKVSSFPSLEIRKLVYAFLNSNIVGTNTTIIEDWMADPQDGKINEPTQYYTPVDYYVSRDKVFYCLRQGGSDKEIRNVLNKAGGAWVTANVVLFVDADLKALIPAVNITEAAEKHIQASTCIFSVSIYDDHDIHLFWIKNGYEKYRELVEQQPFFSR